MLLANIMQNWFKNKNFFAYKMTAGHYVHTDKLNHNIVNRNHVYSTI